MIISKIMSYIIIGGWMILSKVIFDKSYTENVVKFLLDDMRQIIKFEAEIDKFYRKQEQNSRRDEVE